MTYRGRSKKQRSNIIMMQIIVILLSLIIVGIMFVKKNPVHTHHSHSHEVSTASVGTTFNHSPPNDSHSHVNPNMENGFQTPFWANVSFPEDSIIFMQSRRPV